MKTLILNKPVIAVAGSCGKTTTKEMIASILSTRWKIFKSKSSINVRTAHRRNVKLIRPYHKAVVLEFGMSYRGHLKSSCRIIQPNIGIITMVGTAHIGNLGGSLEALIAAKSELIKYMKRDGTLYLNADDYCSKYLHTRNFAGKIIKVGINQPADYKASLVAYVKGGMHFRVQLDGRSEGFFIPVYGKHNVYNALFAIAVTHRLGFNSDDIRKGLRSYRRLKGRLIVYRRKDGIRIIDDTFNANPNSVKAAIDVLSHVGKGRKIAVLGSMRELGKRSLEGHRSVGKYLAKKNIDYVYTYGNNAKNIVRAAVESGFSPKRARHFKLRKNLHHSLRRVIKSNTTLLVKGSHSTNMAQTVRFLRMQ